MLLLDIQQVEFGVGVEDSVRNVIEHDLRAAVGFVVAVVVN